MRHLLWIILIALLTLRVLNYYQTRPTYPNGTKIRITTTVTSEPISYSESQYLKLKGFKLYLPLYPKVSYRDNIVIEGIVEGDKLKKVKLIEINENDNFFPKLRKQLIEIFQRSLPEPHQSLVSGMTLGSKANIPNNFWESLKATGTAHVVVASGMNVSLIAKFLITFLTLFLKRGRALIFAVFGIWVYAFLSGFDAPIVRAAIMGTIAFTAQEAGRLNFALNALFLSAFSMIIYKPDWITDLGFILSFFATLSLVLFEAKVRRIFSFVPKILKEDFSTSLAAQIGVSPILYYYFGQFNVFSPLINAVILWTVVPITIIGSIGGIIGLIYEPIGTLFLWLTYPLTSWFVLIINLMSN